MVVGLGPGRASGSAMAVATDGASHRLAVDAGGSGVVSFAVVAGERVVVGVSGSSFSSSASVLVLDESGAVKGGGALGGGSRFVGPLVAGVSGVWVGQVDAGDVGGSAAVSVWSVPADASGVGGAPSRPGSTAVAFAVSTPGQRARLVFPATAGQRVALRVEGSTIGYASVAVGLADGSGSVIEGWLSYGRSLVGPFVAPRSGVYEAVVVPEVGVVGTFSVSAFDVPPDSVSRVVAPVEGAVTRLVVEAPGQRASLSFAVSAAERYALRVDPSALASGVVRVVDDAGGVVGQSVAGGGAAFLGPFAASRDGVWTVVADGEADTGVVPVTVWRVPADPVVGVPLGIGGLAVSASIAAPGQRARFLVPTSGGERVAVDVVASSVSATMVSVVAADGLVVSSTACGAGACRLPALDAATTASTYSVVVDPQAMFIGDVAVVAQPVGAVTRSRLFVGATSSVAFAVRGETATLDGAGAGGSRVSIVVDPGVVRGSVEVRDGQGALLSAADVGLARSVVGPFRVPLDGAFTVRVAADDPGSITLREDVVVDSAASIAVGDGAGTSVAIGGAGAVGRVTVGLSALDAVRVSLADSTISAGTVSIVDGDGAVVSDAAFATGASAVDLVARRAAVYQVIVVGVDGATGRVAVRVDRISRPALLTTVGVPVRVALTAADSEAAVIVGGAGSGRLAIRASEASTPGVVVVSDQGIVVATARVSTGGSVVVGPLPVADSVFVVFRPDIAQDASLLVSGVIVPADVDASLPVDGASHPVLIGGPGQMATLRFRASSGELVRVGVTGDGSVFGGYTVIAPDGASIAHGVVGDGGVVILAPLIGLYRAVVVPGGGSTGVLGVVAADAGGSLARSIVVDEPAVSVAVGQAGVVFDAPATRVSLLVDGASFTGHAQLVDSAGVARGSVGIGADAASSDPIALPGGSYRIVVSADQPVDSAARVGVRVVASGADAVLQTATGSGGVVSRIERPGQRLDAAITQAGTGLVIVGIDAPALAGAMVTITTPHGAVQTIVHADRTIIGVPGVEAGGVVRVLVDPTGSATGSVRIDAASSSSVSVIADGSPVALARIGGVDASAIVHRGIAGVVSFVVSDANDGFGVAVRDADGSPVASAVTTGGGAWVGPQRLAAGDSSMTPTSAGAVDGVVVVRAYDTPVRPALAVPAGAAVRVDVGVPGASSTFSVGVHAGQRFGVAVEVSSIASLRVVVHDPSGRVVGLGDRGGVAVLSATTTGRYTVRVDASDASTGQARIRLVRAAAPTSRTLATGTTRRVAIGAGGAMAWRVRLVVGSVLVTTTTSGIGAGVVRLVAADGTIIGSTPLSAPVTSLAATITAAGVYRVDVDPTDGASGTIDTRVDTSTTPASDLVVGGDPQVVQVAARAGVARTIEASDTPTIIRVSDAPMPISVVVRDDTGTIVASDASVAGGGGVRVGPVTLVHGGSVDLASLGAGGFATITAFDDVVVRDTTSVDDAPTTLAITEPGGSAQLAVDGVAQPASLMITVAATGLSGGSVTVRAGGLVLAEATLGVSGARLSVVAGADTPFTVDVGAPPTAAGDVTIGVTDPSGAPVAVADRAPAALVAVGGDAALVAPSGALAVGETHLEPRLVSDGQTIHSDGSLTSTTLGASASGGVRLETSRGPIVVSTTGRAARQGLLVGDGAVVYQGVAASTDEVRRATALGFESFLQLRGASAPTVFQWSVALPPGARLEQVSPTRVAVITIAPAGDVTTPVDPVGGDQRVAQTLTSAVSDPASQLADGYHLFAAAADATLAQNPPRDPADAATRTTSRAWHVLAVFDAPWAIDHTMTHVPTSLLVGADDSITLSVAHASTQVTYPVIVDPSIVTDEYDTTIRDYQRLFEDDPQALQPSQTSADITQCVNGTTVTAVDCQTMFSDAGVVADDAAAFMAGLPYGAAANERQTRAFRHAWWQARLSLDLAVAELEAAPATSESQIISAVGTLGTRREFAAPTTTNGAATPFSAASTASTPSWYANPLSDDDACGRSIATNTACPALGYSPQVGAPDPIATMVATWWTAFRNHDPWAASALESRRDGYVASVLPRATGWAAGWARDTTVGVSSAPLVGLERQYAYTSGSLGWGAQWLVNDATNTKTNSTDASITAELPNILVHWTPLSSAGKGLSTVVSVTYNSREKRSTTLVSPSAAQTPSALGNGWVLSVSGLTPLNEGLDVSVAGEVRFRDRDGTPHRYLKSTGPVVGGVEEYWPTNGEQLYVAHITSASVEPVTTFTAADGSTSVLPTPRWEITTREGTTYDFTDAGWPLDVRDLVNNRISYTYRDGAQNVAAPGTASRVSSVVDQRGRAYTITYKGLSGASFWLVASITAHPTTPRSTGGVPAPVTPSMMFSYRQRGALDGYDLRVFGRCAGVVASCAATIGVTNDHLLGVEYTTIPADTSSVAQLSSVTTVRSITSAVAPITFTGDVTTVSTASFASGANVSASAVVKVAPPLGDATYVVAVPADQQTKVIQAPSATISALAPAPDRLRVVDYDTLGRPVRVTVAANASLAATAGNAVTRLTWFDDPSYTTPTLGYLRANLVTRLVDPTGAVTTTTFTAQGMPASITDDNGDATSFVYTSFSLYTPSSGSVAAPVWLASQTKKPNGAFVCTDYQPGSVIRAAGSPSVPVGVVVATREQYDHTAAAAETDTCATVSSSSRVFRTTTYSYFDASAATFADNRYQVRMVSVDPSGANEQSGVDRWDQNGLPVRVWHGTSAAASYALHDGQGQTVYQQDPVNDSLAGLAWTTDEGTATVGATNPVDTLLFDPNLQYGAWTQRDGFGRAVLTSTPQWAAKRPGVVYVTSASFNDAARTVSSYDAALQTTSASDPYQSTPSTLAAASTGQTTTSDAVDRPTLTQRLPITTAPSTISGVGAVTTSAATETAYLPTGEVDYALDPAQYQNWARYAAAVSRAATFTERQFGVATRYDFVGHPFATTATSLSTTAATDTVTPSQRTVERCFDRVGRVIATLRPSTAAFAADGVTPAPPSCGYPALGSGRPYQTMDYYDGVGRVVRHFDVRSSPTTNLATAYTYDADGNVQRVVDPANATTTNAYTDADQQYGSSAYVTTIGASPGIPVYAASYTTYTGAGRVAATIDSREASQLRYAVQDPATLGYGSVVSALASAAVPAARNTWSCGLLASQSRPGTGDTRFSLYDANERVVAVSGWLASGASGYSYSGGCPSSDLPAGPVLPAGTAGWLGPLTTRVARLDPGQIVADETPGRMAVVYGYGSALVADRQTSRLVCGTTTTSAAAWSSIMSWSGTAPTCKTPSVNEREEGWGYDTSGWADPVATHTWDAAATNYQESFASDRDGRMTTATAPTGTVTQSYNGFGEPRSTTSNTTPVLVAGNGPQPYGSGTTSTTSYGYDADGNVLNRVTSDPSSNETHTYTYYPGGVLATDTLPPTVVPLTATVQNWVYSYSYDADMRTTQVRGTDSVRSVEQDTGYTAGGLRAAYSTYANAQNQALTMLERHTYSYTDTVASTLTYEDGSTTSETCTGPRAPCGISTYTFDAQNRLATSTVQQGYELAGADETDCYTYNPDSTVDTVGRYANGISAPGCPTASTAGDKYRGFTRNTYANGRLTTQDVSTPREFNQTVSWNVGPNVVIGAQQLTTYTRHLVYNDAGDVCRTRRDQSSIAGPTPAVATSCPTQLADIPAGRSASSPTNATAFFNESDTIYGAFGRVTTRSTFDQPVAYATRNVPTVAGDRNDDTYRYDALGRTASDLADYRQQPSTDTTRAELTFVDYPSYVARSNAPLTDTTIGTTITTYGATTTVAGQADLAKIYTTDAYGTNQRVSYTKAPPSGPYAASMAPDTVGGPLYYTIPGPRGTTSIILDTNANVVQTVGQNTDGTFISAYSKNLLTNAAPWATANNAARLFQTDLTSFSGGTYNVHTADGSITSVGLGQRSYNANIGAFTQLDTYHDANADLGLTLDPLNNQRYSYGAANSVTYIDPDGHDVCDYCSPAQYARVAAQVEVKYGGTGGHWHRRPIWIAHGRARPTRAPNAGWVNDGFQTAESGGPWYGGFVSGVASVATVGADFAYTASGVRDVYEGCISSFSVGQCAMGVGSVGLTVISGGESAVARGVAEAAVKDVIETGARTAAEAGGDLAGPLSKVEFAGLQKSLDANKLNHIFGKAEHGLDPLVQRFGSQEAVVEQMYRGLEAAVPASGRFTVTRLIGGQSVVIDGAVVDGVPRIGTAYIRP